MHLLPRLMLGVMVVLLMVGATAQALPPVPPNIRITYIPQDNNEEQVVICPTDTNVVMAIWRDFRIGFRQVALGRSIDGGQTWTDSLIPWWMQLGYPDVSYQTDPTLNVDRNGNIIATALDFDPQGGPNTCFLALYRSIDRGLSWSGPFKNTQANGSSFEDKQFVAIDCTAGQYDGNVYIVWGRFAEPVDITTGRLMFVRASNDLLTISDTVVLAGVQTSSGCGSQKFPSGEWAMPVVGKDGTVHVFWIGETLDSGAVCNHPWSLKLISSSNAGDSWGPIEVLTTVRGWAPMRSGVLSPPQPISVCDLSNGPNGGDLYLMYPKPEPNVNDVYDVYLVRSDDGGETWSAPLTVNDDPTTGLNSSFMPWLAINDEGVLTAIFYDERLDPNHINFDLWAAYSFDGGRTFTTNHRISSASSTPFFGASTSELPESSENPYLNQEKGGEGTSQGQMEEVRLGEYIGVTMADHRIVAEWTDVRHGQQEVYTANWYLPMIEPRLYYPGGLDSIVASTFRYRWATSWLETDDQYEIQVTTDTQSTPTVVQVYSDTNFFDQATPLADGQYFWRGRTIRKSDNATSGFGKWYPFQVDMTPPGVPLLFSPANNVYVFTATPDFVWAAQPSLEPGQKFDLLISTDSVFTPGPNTYVYADIATEGFTPASPLPEGAYYWKVVTRDIRGNEATSASARFTYQISCCIGTVGNADNDPGDAVDLSDLQTYIDYLFFGGGIGPCLEENDTVIDGAVDIADLQVVVDYLFFGSSLTACP